ncbi:MAG: endonuclease/exonuclease/phosphatase family protein [Oligoflexia bacterium]|nr:endonuclease/exonuclease/phosphatase family protein [Oligoflexia bacterium]
MIFKALFFSLVLSNLGFASSSICIQTFNAYGTAYAPKVKKRFTNLSQKILSENCDIVQIQEVWQEKHFNLLDKAFSKSKYSVTHADQFRKDRAITGLVSLLKPTITFSYSELFQINNQKNPLDLIRDLIGVQKGIFLNEVFLKEQNDKIRIINMHTHPQSEFVRLAQIIQLVELEINRAPHSNPVVILGDLNAEPLSLEIALLKKTLLLEDAYLAVQNNYKDICTYCKDNPLGHSSNDRVIDYIFTAAGSRTKLDARKAFINFQEFNGETLSDHYGVKVEFSFVEPGRVLDWNHQTVQKRVKEAKSVLVQAKNILEQKNKRLYKNSINIASKLIEQFENKSFSPEFKQRILRDN